MWHEDADTKRREQMVAGFLRERTGMSVHLNENYAGADYLYYNKKYSRYMYAELKTRNCRWEDYPDWMLEQGKFGQMVPHLHTGVGFQYIIATYDKLAIWTALHASKVQDYRRNINGRRDRNDPKDMKLCIYIPSDDFYVAELTKDERTKLWKT